MSQTVIVLHDKNGPTLFANAVAAVKYQIETMYRHLDDETLVLAALTIVEHNNEKAAWHFLRKRDAGEYEGVDRDEVLTLDDIEDYQP